MEGQYITLEAAGMITPLGRGVSENYRAVLQGNTCLSEHRDTFGVREPFVASLFNRQRVEADFTRLVCSFQDHPAIGSKTADAPYTFFEKLLIMAIADAVKSLPASVVQSRQTLLVLSSTKGNVTLLQHEANDPRIMLGETAKRIANFFGMPTEPVVVSNACISGVSAQILAQRLLLQRAYRHIIVAGGDEQSRFIVSGFQSFKALSPTRCRPYDARRDGLNLGEAAAAMVLTMKEAQEIHPNDWCLIAGGIRNDANHISGPSRVGEGSFLALRQTVSDADIPNLAFINAHGTATLYNDEMESIAIDRAGLADVPVNALKGLFGHTMGAAGILETLLSIEALRHGTILSTHGFSRLGVSRPIRVSGQSGETNRRSFVKLMSGFGGCNAAVRYAGGVCSTKSRPTAMPSAEYQTTHSLRILSDGTLTIDGRATSFAEKGSALLTALYRQRVNNYPKFFKMDPLCRLGFIASELLLQTEGCAEEEQPRTDRAIVVCSRHGSYANDLRYQQTIANDNYFPSPAVFVYTLANIVTGEIAIRHHYRGETSCFLLRKHQAERVRRLAATAFCDAQTGSVLCAWIDCRDSEHFEATLELLERIERDV